MLWISVRMVSVSAPALTLSPIVCLSSGLVLCTTSALCSEVLPLPMLISNQGSDPATSRNRHYTHAPGCTDGPQERCMKFADTVTMNKAFFLVDHLAKIACIALTLFCIVPLVNFHIARQTRPLSACCGLDSDARSSDGL